MNSEVYGLKLVMRSIWIEGLAKNGYLEGEKVNHINRLINELSSFVGKLLNASERTLAGVHDGEKED